MHKLEDAYTSNLVNTGVFKSNPLDVWARKVDLFHVVQLRQMGHT